MRMKNLALSQRRVRGRIGIPAGFGIGSSIGIRRRVGDDIGIDSGFVIGIALSVAFV